MGAEPTVAEVEDLKAAIQRNCECPHTVFPVGRAHTDACQAAQRMLDPAPCTRIVLWRRAWPYLDIDEFRNP